MNRIIRSLGALALPVVLAACSQISALTPVGGTAISAVRSATIDVLLDQGIEILVAPVCEARSEGFTCTGTTIDGREILATAALTAPYDLRIEVGGERIFEGTAQDVLDQAVLESS